jgi:N4-gp56 family major capsid protein
MAETRFETSDALTVKKWASRLGYDVVYRSDLSSMIGEDETSIISMKNELSKGPGDNILFPLMKKLTGAGFTTQEVAEGNGESLSLYSDNLYINELGHVVSIPNEGRSIDVQRVPIKLRSAAKNGLMTWVQERMSQTFFYHVCGWTRANALGAKFYGNNAVVAPSSGRVLWRAAGASESNTADENIESDDIFSLNMIDHMRETAESASSPVRPINIEGNYEAGGVDISGGKYVMYIHPYQYTDLRTSTDTGQWLDIQKAALMGGNQSKNPIFSDALGEYNNVILKKSNHVTTGINSSTGAEITTVRRSVLLGAQAVALAYGKDGGPTTYNWNEELFDHKRVMEVSTFCIWGMKKVQFASTDFGTIVGATYAAAHATG